MSALLNIGQSSHLHKAIFNVRFRPEADIGTTLVHLHFARWHSPDMNPRLVPELNVVDLQESLNFYTGVLGFRVLYDRMEERFAYLDIEGAHLMIEEISEQSRQFSTAPLERPLGRGLNMQIQISKVDDLYERVLLSHAKVIVAMEEKWYRMETQEGGNRQFIVSDPDGYLLRFYSHLGSRPLQP